MAAAHLGKGSRGMFFQRFVAQYNVFVTCTQAISLIIHPGCGAFHQESVKRPHFLQRTFACKLCGGGDEVGSMKRKVGTLVRVDWGERGRNMGPTSGWLGGGGVWWRGREAGGGGNSSGAALFGKEGSQPSKKYGNPIQVVHQKVRNFWISGWCSRGGVVRCGGLGCVCVWCCSWEKGGRGMRPAGRWREGGGESGACVCMVSGWCAEEPTRPQPKSSKIKCQGPDKC